ncbi:salivary glue protein Sgs-4-like isoform X2 [Periplaneta americana]|uniref:salivary glue protein Sgs-4-like isoform X2 n=1 Tax=Periplaneta americana TaxID=6978 RepID=UPI0037E981B5
MISSRLALLAVIVLIGSATGMPQRDDTKDEIDNTIPQKSEVITQKSEYVTPKSEPVTQKTETSTHKTETVTSKSEPVTQKTEHITQKTHTVSQKSDSVTQKTETATKKSAANTVTPSTTPVKVHITRAPPTSPTTTGFSKFINDVFQIPISVLKAVSNFITSSFGGGQKKS